MSGRFLLAVVSICIGACASSGPEAPEPVATSSTQGVETVAANNSAAEPAEDFYALEPDGVEPDESEVRPEKSNEMICRREKLTGSNIARRICRTRAEIEAQAAEAQQQLHEMRSPRTGSQDAMQGQR